METHLRTLRYLVAIADAGNISAAAQQLYVAQPSLSKQIRVLEQELGYQLFERHHEGVSPTPSGAVLIQHARTILEEWAHAQDQARQLAQPHTLRVGLQTAVGRGIIARLTRDLDPEQWTVRVNIVAWGDPTAGLKDGRTDLALLWAPASEQVRTVATLATEPICALVPVEHPLAHRARIRFHEIADDPIVALPSNAGPLRDYWIGAAHRHRPARIAAEAATADEAVEAVNSGTGIALLSQGNSELYCRPGTTAVPIADLPPAHLLLCVADPPTRAASEFLARSRPTQAPHLVRPTDPGRVPSQPPEAG